MKRLTLIIFLLLIVAAVVSACGPAAAAPVAAPSGNTAEGVAPAETLAVEQQAAEADARAVFGETQVDDQGAVSVAVTPLPTGENADTLAFEIAMNTHSVDLSMDLATLASLSTETGFEVVPLTWEAPQGGHHVSGILTFPDTVDGKPFLDGATSVTLTLEGVDAPMRIFSWSLD